MPISRSVSTLVLELGVWMFSFAALLAHACKMLPLVGFNSGLISSPQTYGQCSCLSQAPELCHSAAFTLTLAFLSQLLALLLPKRGDEGEG